MTESETVTMDPKERDEFLGNGGTGVISFGTAGGEPPHSIPVSYGYDAVEDTFYFRLAGGSDSEKGEMAGRKVSFVTHGQGEDGLWRSVVASGRLDATTAKGIATETLEGLDRVHIPLVNVFGRPTKDVQFEFFRLEPEELTARVESKTRT